MVIHSEHSGRQPNEERLFPRLEGRQTSYKHTSLADQRLAVGLMGEEAQDRGNRLWTANELATLYPTARIAMLQYTIDGREETSFIFPNDGNLFNILFATLTECGVVSTIRTSSNPGTSTNLSLVDSINRVTTGEDSEALLTVTFEGALTSKIAGKLIDYLNRPPVLTVDPFPPGMNLRGGFITRTRNTRQDRTNPEAN